MFLSDLAFSAVVHVHRGGLVGLRGLSVCPLLAGHSVPRKLPQSFKMSANNIGSETLTLDMLKELLAKEVVSMNEAIAAADSSDGLEKVRVEYMGKKGKITSFMKAVGKLPPDERPKLGAVVNVVRDEVTTAIAVKKEQLAEADLEKEYEDSYIDVTLPGLRRRPHVGYIHPLNSTMDKAIDVFVNLGYDLIDETSEYNREIEDDYYCFEALNCPKDHPARDMQDTFYMEADKSVLLRTQTSSVQIRYMEEHKPPFAIIAPGRVYRRDSVDSTHSPVFHQIEILSVRPMGELNVGSLRATIIHFLKAMFGPDIDTRFRGSYFPFTEPSMEVDVFFRGRWLEVLGCGMVDPAVLENVGIDPTKYSGFAAGFGVERFAMVIHEIPDIRELYRSDTRFLEQFSIESDLRL
jgi:phenylalanyl-tRNA synthetase alpha chain